MRGAKQVDERVAVSSEIYSLTSQMPQESSHVAPPPARTAMDGDLTALGIGNVSAGRLTVILALLLAVGTAVLYLPAVKNGFVNFDDPDYVTHNAHVLQGLLWSNLAWAFGTNNPAANWHPLTWISHMLDVQWYGLNPAGHHFTNVLLQVLNVVILFLLLQRATKRTLRSAAVAAFFALHPLNVESVAWVAERKAVLCMFFLLLALWAYGWYASRPSVLRYLSVMLFFALGLMAKIMVIAFPAALLLLDYWPLRRLPATDEVSDTRQYLRTLRKLVIEKLPLLLLAAAAGWMTIYMHRKDGALAGSMPLAWRMKNALYSYAAYLGKAVWPVHLAVFYPHPENSLAWWKVIVAALVLVGISAIVWQNREKRYLVVGWLWYLGTMLPMIGIVQSGRQGMADRYSYIPMLGIFLAVVWLAGDWSAKLNSQHGLVAAGFVLLISPYAYATHRQIGYWRDSYTLFEHTLQVTRNNGIAENNFGAALMEMGQPQLAGPHFAAAVRFVPELASAHYNLGTFLQRQNQSEEAARQYRLAIATSSDAGEIAQAHNNLGFLLLQSGDGADAIKEFSNAIALNPLEQNSYIGRGMAEQQSWNFDGAIADLSRATDIAPSPIAWFWLGRTFESKGDAARAARAYIAALRLAPDMTDARTRLELLAKKAAEQK